jgi:hypothetical protein
VLTDAVASRPRSARRRYHFEQLATASRAQSSLRSGHLTWRK